MTTTHMDQNYACSAAITPYSYLARKYLGLRDTYIAIPIAPLPKSLDSKSPTPDFWLLDPEKFKELWFSTPSIVKA